VKVDAGITWVCVEVPDNTDLDTPEGYQILKRAVQKEYLQLLESWKFDVCEWEIYEEVEN
jgi:hypothetical protein